MRNRLTNRIASKNRKAESQADGLFPGDVGNMERSKNYHKMDEYDNFEPSLNHWTPDMRHDWKDNPREETGHGIPKMAKVYMAAKKATKLAMMLLGDEAKEEVIEAQARDFMRMGSKALSASVNRWAEIAALADDDEEEEQTEDEATKETPVACNCADDECEAPAVTKEPTVPVADEEAPVAPAEVPAEAPVAEETAPEEVAAEDEETDVVGDDEEEMDVTVDDGLIPTDVEFDDADEGEVSADEELENIFDGEDGEEEIAPVEEAPIASKKAGIKRLAGQPKLVRVASKKDADELSGLWSKWDSPNLR